MNTAPAPQSAARWVDTYWLAGLIGLHLLQLPYLATYPLAVDEPFSIYYARHSAWDGLMALRYDRHPPLYIFLLHEWIGVFGDSVWAVRGLSFLFSTLAVVAMYRLGTAHFGRVTGLAAAALFNLSNLQVHYGQETRSYALLVLASTLSLLTFSTLVSQARQGRVSRPVLLRYVGSSLLVGYTHYFGLELLLVEGGIVWLLPELKPVRRSVLRAAGGFALGFAPVFYMLGASIKHNVVEKKWWLHAPSSWAQVLAPVADLANSAALGVGLTALIVGVYGRALVRNPRSVSWFEIVLLLLYPGVWIGKLVVSYLLSPMYLDRFLIHTTPAFYLLAAGAVARLLTAVRLQPAWGLAGLVGLVGLGYSPVYDRHWNMQRTMQTVASLRTPGTVVYVYPEYLEINALYYGYPDYFRITPRHVLRRQLPANVYPLATADTLDARTVQRATKVILINAEPQAEAAVNWHAPTDVRRLRPADHYRRLSLETIDVHVFDPAVK